MIDNPSVSEIRQFQNPSMKKLLLQPYIIDRANLSGYSKTQQVNHERIHRESHPSPLFTRKSDFSKLAGTTLPSKRILTNSKRKINKIELELGLLKLLQSTQKPTKFAWDRLSREGKLERIIEKSLKKALSEYTKCTKCGCFGLALASPSFSNFTEKRTTFPTNDSSQESLLLFKKDCSDLKSRVYSEQDSTSLSRMPRVTKHEFSDLFLYKSHYSRKSVGHSPIDSGAAALSLVVGSRLHRAFDLISLSRNKQNSLTFDLTCGGTIFGLAEEEGEISSIEEKSFEPRNKREPMLKHSANSEFNTLIDTLY